MKVWVKSLIGSLLALLGFQACNPFSIFESPDMYGPKLSEEYGCPEAFFTFIGEASDEEGNPIPGIRIAVFHNGEDASYSYSDTLYTGENGKVKEHMIFVSPATDRMVVKFEDVDGEANGSFEAKKLSGDALSVVQTSEGDGNWNQGEFTLTAKAVLKKKEAE